MLDEAPLLQIIEGCRQKKSDAEEALFRRYAPKVLAMTRRYANDEPQAHDYLQECFIVLFDKIDRYNPQRGQFEGWLHRLCVNVILQLIRKNKPFAAIEFPADIVEEAPSENEWGALSETQILDALRLLPPGYREVFNLYVFEQLAHRDIATLLGITESASRSQLTRARKWLQQKLLQTIKKYEQGLV
jgi:RNA polymerase sigma factor (sigma-70 family)